MHKFCACQSYQVRCSRHCGVKGCAALQMVSVCSWHRYPSSFPNNQNTHNQAMVNSTLWFPQCVIIIQPQYCTQTYFVAKNNLKKEVWGGLMVACHEFKFYEQIKEFDLYNYMTVRFSVSLDSSKNLDMFPLLYSDKTHVSNKK